MAYINVDEVYILDNTGLQVDMATDIPFADAGFSDAQKEQARANIGAGGTNPNLLMNPFFTVNQRGVSGAVAGGQYGPDRWSLNASSGVSANMGTGYITLPSGGYEVIQTIEGLSSTYGKQVTYSVLDDTGEIRSATITMPTTPAVQNYINTTINGVRLRLRYLNPNWRVFMDAQDGAAHTIKAAKLEIGSVSTLANDAAPDYWQELDKCLYYFERIKARGNYSSFGSGVAASATIASILVPMHPKRNNSYTITTSGAFGVIGGTVTSMAKDNASSNYALNLAVTGTFTSGAAALLRSQNDANAYIDVINDL